MRRVYFIKPVGLAGPIKIGCSNTPGSRLSALDTWSPFALEIIGEIEGGFDIERRFHALFVKHHERREWFTASKQIMAVIKSINAGTFDISTLPKPICVQSKIAGKSRQRTELQKKDFSYSSRIWRVQDRTNFLCPVSSFRMVQEGDQERIAAVDQYLKEPQKYGRPRGEYLAELLTDLEKQQTIKEGRDQ